MASWNRVQILGHLGQDPELRHTGAGLPVLSLSVATKDGWTDKQGGRRENTEWHRVVVWDKLAETCAKFLSKGKPVLIEGRLQTRGWEDQSGVKRLVTEIVAQHVQFLAAPVAKAEEETPGSEPSTKSPEAAFASGEEVPF